MIISDPCVVSLTWTLSDGQNRPIDELAEPVEFYFGGDDLLAKVEEALAGHAIGDALQLHLEPEHAFGDYRAELVCFEDRKLFPEKLETGMAFAFEPKVVFPGEGAIGIENTFYLSMEGLKQLTHSNEDLIILPI